MKQKKTKKTNRKIIAYIQPDYADDMKGVNEGTIHLILTLFTWILHTRSKCLQHYPTAGSTRVTEAYIVALTSFQPWQHRVAASHNASASSTVGALPFGCKPSM
jgi:hypothetical protein